jgi:hypothetical protein
VLLAETTSLRNALLDISKKLDDTKVEILNMGRDIGRVLPEFVTKNLPHMLFAVISPTTATPVGVSFFVRPTLAITAYHVLSTHYPQLKVDGKVHLMRESDLSLQDPRLSFATTLRSFNSDQDWALMQLDVPDASIIPFIIGDAVGARYERCQFLSFNIGLSAFVSAQDVLRPHITNVEAIPHDVCNHVFSYTCALSQAGDSGGAVVVGKNGHVVAMHCEFVNSMTEQLEVKRNKKSKTDMEQIDEVRSKTDMLRQQIDEVSSGRSQGVCVGLRMDFLQDQGLFDA